MKETAMITAKISIEITEHEARALWCEVTEQSDTVPTGQELAEWVAQHLAYHIEGDTQDDHGINLSAVQDDCSSDTQETLDRIRAIDAELDQLDTDSNVPRWNALKEEREELKEELGLGDLPEESETDLE